MTPILCAGIIAAGEGSRFRQSGVQTHKPMILLDGFPLIGHTLRNLQAAGVQKVAIIFNEQETECAEWVRKNFPELGLQILIKSTPSSFESFWHVGRLLGEGRHLLSTVDSFCLPEDTRKMLEKSSPDGISLGLTAFVDDEKPLWVSFDEPTGKISEIGTPNGKYATAGFYNVPGSIFAKRPDLEMSSLRTFLKWLVNQGVPAHGVVLSKVVDIDWPKDLEEAEKLIKGQHA